MDSRDLRFLAAALILLAAACGGNPKPVDPSSLPSDQALYDQGTAALEKEDWDRGRTLLQQLVDSYPQSSLTAKARIAIADSHFKQDDEVHRAQAEVEYQAFISLYPFSESAAYSQYQIGLLKFRHIRIWSRDQENTTSALKAFQKVATDYPNSEYAQLAKEKIVECRERLAEHEMGVGLFYYKRSSYDSAVTRLKQLIDEYPDFSGMDKVYFHLAESLYKQGKLDEALPYYRKVTEGKPGEFTARASERLKEVERASQ